MAQFLADENFNKSIVEGVLLRASTIAFHTAQAFGLAGTPDDLLLEWAAEQGYVLVSHDENTLIGFAYRRIGAGLPCPGVVIVRWGGDVGAAVVGLVAMFSDGREGSFRDLVRFVH